MRQREEVAVLDGQADPVHCRAIIVAAALCPPVIILLELTNDQPHVGLRTSPRNCGVIADTHGHQRHERGNQDGDDADHGSVLKPA